jgi:hypothetical protein
MAEMWSRTTRMLFVLITTIPIDRPAILFSSSKLRQRKQNVKSAFLGSAQQFASFQPRNTKLECCLDDKSLQQPQGGRR